MLLMYQKVKQRGFGGCEFLFQNVRASCVGTEYFTPGWRDFESVHC